MGVRDVTGVLSRYFVLGYFVPAFFGLALLSRLLATESLPDDFEALGDAAQLAVVGAFALLAGLVLLGLRYPVMRLLQGYVLDARGLRPLRRPLLALQRRSYDRLVATRETGRTAAERSRAAYALDRRFHRQRDRILPTRLGNAFRAFEHHAYTRHGLDSVACWPRIHPLLGEQERELHVNAQSDLAFFVNGAIVSLAAGLALVADRLAHASPGAAGWLALVLVPLALAALSYRAAIGAVERFGTERRASVDLHRLELYELLGIRRPTSFADEHELVAPAVNAWLLRAERPPDDLFARPPEKEARS